MSSMAHILETAETLLRYREEEFLCDTSIMTSDRQIKAHSVLLAAVSPVFRGAFASNASSSGIYQVDLQNVESHVLETALDFIYTGQLIVPSPEYATQEQLSVLFSTLQDLGLDISKLNGCEIKFKSEMKKQKKAARQVSSSDKPSVNDQIERNIKDEVEEDRDTEAPIKLNEVALEDVTPAKTQSNKEVKFKCVVSFKDDEQEDSSVANELSPAGSDETADDANGCDDDDVDTDMDAVEGEHCLLVENSENDGEEPKYYFMLVPKNSGKSGEGKNAIQSNKHGLKSLVKSTHLCDICGHAFAQKSSLDEHVLTKHGGEDDSESIRTYHCTVCGELFDGEDKIREHLDSSAECAAAEPSAMQVSMLTPVDVRRPFLCDTCGKNFSSALSLRMHTKLHTGERPFACSTCGKSFVQKVQLVQHEQRHLGIRPYACDLCDRTFSQKGQLTLHTRLHTGERPFVCEYCNASNVSRPLLTQHRRQHNGERPHVCATCNKSFAHKESLIVHMRTHTGEKPFECTVCGNRYTQSHHLKGHMRTHTGEKPFACQLCEKTYKNRVDLRFHCTRVHGIDISKRKAKPLVFAADVAESIAGDIMETDSK